MYRLGIPLVAAEELGYYLGLTVPKDVAELFWNPRVRSKSPPSGWGTQIYKREFAANKAFKKLEIPLTMKLQPISRFRDFRAFKKYLLTLSSSDFDVLACFHHGTLTGEIERDCGHVCVIDRIYPSKDRIRLIDSARAPKWRTVSARRLFAAMKAHPVKASSGFWEISIIRDA